MKKIFAIGMLAICSIAMSQQQASAWINTRFGIGLNWGWQSGGNNFGWGAIRGAQPPGPEHFSMPHGHYYSHGAMPSFTPPAPVPVAETQAPPSAYTAPSYGPFHYATYPRPVYYYYYPAPTYYYGQ